MPLRPADPGEDWTECRFIVAAIGTPPGPCGEDPGTGRVPAGGGSVRLPDDPATWQSFVGTCLGVPALLALCSALLEKSLRGGLAVVGDLNLGGAVDPVHNAVSVAEIAVEKGATILLMPVSARRQLNDLSDDMATKISILFYSDARDALLKALGD